jgi:hypothetical protein
VIPAALLAEAVECRRELLAHLSDLTEEAEHDARALGLRLWRDLARQYPADDRHEPSDEILELAHSLREIFLRRGEAILAAHRQESLR